MQANLDWSLTLKSWFNNYRQSVWVVLTAKALFFIWAGLNWHLSQADLSFTRTLVRWDALHYIEIARSGYSDNLADPNSLLIVFLPALPTIIKILSSVSAWSLEISALVVANIISIGTALALGRLAKNLYGPEIARWSVVWLFALPTSYFLHLPYTEGLFLLGAILAIQALEQAKTTQSFLTAGLAGLTRLTGLALIAVGAAKILIARGEKKSRAAWAMIAGSLTAFGLYLGLNNYLFGNALAFSTFQSNHWQRQLSWPGGGLVQLIGSWWYYSDFTTRRLYVGWELLALALMIAGLIFTLKKRQIILSTYTFGVIMLSISTSFIYSLPRFSLVVFPITFMLASLTRRRPVLGWIVLILFLASQIELSQRYFHYQWAY